MGLLGRLPKNGSNSATSGVAPTSVGAGVSDGQTPAPQMQQGQPVELNNALQLVNRIELSPNTRAKIQQSIALNIAANGQDKVLGNIKTEMDAFRTYRNNVLDAFAAQGQEPPPELLTRLNDLEKTTGQRITFQSMRSQDAAQLSNVFGPRDLISQELDTRLEIDDFVRPVTTAKLQQEYQKGLISVAQAGATLRKNNIANAQSERNLEVERYSGKLDELFPDPSPEDLKLIMSGSRAGNLGVPADIAGEWARKRLQGYLSNRKLEAEINAKNTATGISSRNAREKQRKLRLNSVFDAMSTDTLRGLADNMAANGGTRSISGFNITAQDAISAVERRIKSGEQFTALQLEQTAEYVDSVQDVSRLERFEKENLWHTGNPNSQELLNAQAAEAQAVELLKQQFPENSPQFRTAVTRLRQEFRKNNKELVKNATAALEANANEQEIALKREFLNTGSLSFSQGVADTIAPNPNFAYVIPRNSLYREVADVWQEGLDGVQSANEDGQIDYGKYGGEAREFNSPFAAGNSAKEIKQFLNQPAGPETQVTRRELMRRKLHGSVQGVAAFAKLRAEDNGLVQGTVLGEANTSGQPMFNEEGLLNPEFRTDDGETNFYRMFLEAHLVEGESSSLFAPNEQVAGLRDALISFPRQGTPQASDFYETVLRAATPQTREEALISSMVQAEVNQKGTDKLYTVGAQQDMNLMIGRDMQENVELAYRQYLQFIRELPSQTSGLGGAPKRAPKRLGFDAETTSSSIREDVLIFTGKRKEDFSNEAIEAIRVGITESKSWSPNGVISDGR